MTSQTLHIGTLDIDVEVLPYTTERDASVPAITAQKEPLTVSEWPMSAADLEATANAKLSASGGKPERRDDCLWALSAIGLATGYIIRGATTAAQRSSKQDQARGMALRGELS